MGIRQAGDLSHVSDWRFVMKGKSVMHQLVSALDRRIHGGQSDAAPGVHRCDLRRMVESKHDVAMHKRSGIFVARHGLSNEPRVTRRVGVESEEREIELLGCEDHARRLKSTFEPLHVDERSAVASHVVVGQYVSRREQDTAARVLIIVIRRAEVDRAAHHHAGIEGDEQSSRGDHDIGPHGIVA